jgi:hypothetical protein
MQRRRFVSLVLVLALLAAGPAALAFAADSSSPDLQSTLEAGLKARRPEEFQFIARVVQLVNQGRLDEDLVRGTFLWARKKRKHPFQYFEFAIRRKAREVGILL